MGDTDAYISGINAALKDLASKTIETFYLVHRYEAIYDREAERCRLFGV